MQFPTITTTKLRNSQCGGILFRSSIVIVTLTFVGITIFFLLHTFGQNQQNNHRKALAISEYGMMITLQKLQEYPLEIANIEKTEYEEGWYKVTMNKENRNDSLYLTINSEGHCGSSTERRQYVLRLTTSDGDTSWVRAAKN